MPVRKPLRAALRQLLGPSRAALAGGIGLALLLAPLDLSRQLLVRQDPSRLHALLVDVVGVLTATVGQLALIGALASPGSAVRRWLPDGSRLLQQAVRRRPGVVLAALAAAGLISAVLTLPVSIAALSPGQVLGPLNDPPIGALLLAGASDAVATAVSAPYFAVLVLGLRANGPART